MNPCKQPIEWCHAYMLLIYAAQGELPQGFRGQIEGLWVASYLLQLLRTRIEGLSSNSRVSHPSGATPYWSHSSEEYL